jgi:enoyl-CoA hydratase/carnithine racemase
MSAAELEALLASPVAVDDLAAAGPPALLVHGEPVGDLEVPPVLPVVIVAVGSRPAPAPWSDVTTGGDDLERILETVASAPVASSALAVLLRGSDRRSVADGLLAESAVYGALQAGDEFARWRLAHPARSRPVEERPAVVGHRSGDVLDVVLNRPAVRNAVDAEMRDALVPWLHLALSDPSLQVRLRGEGPAFCAGGHLDELGTRRDPAAAHRIRLVRSIGWLLHQLSDRTRSHVHGPCRGSGVELPAFTGTVVADPDATFGLPEVALGLVPGAGGTVSLPRRIGRHRTAWLALTGESIGAEQARRWGLVDGVRPVATWRQD